LEKTLDDIDGRLVNLVQAQFPLDREPFAALGLVLGVSGDEVIRRIQGLKDQGIVRLISPVFNAATLGYKTTLVAARVAVGRLEAAAQTLIEHPGIGHCYERDHEFNLWSTLALPGDVDIDMELQRLGGLIGAEVIFDLPTARTFKIGAYFDVGGEGCPTNDRGASQVRPGGGPVELSVADRVLVNALQQDLALVDRPFDGLAAQAGLDVVEFLVQCRSLVQRGVIRRYGASINHRNVGYMANAMICWVVPPDMVQAVGEMLAALPAVSHCYERKVNEFWRYNLFSMVHSRAREECQTAADRISLESGVKDFVLLFSTREHKKVRVNYKV
jgi:DNA-binding Lrp family transcriptional regulator